MINSVPARQHMAADATEKRSTTVKDWKLQITANYKKWLNQLEAPPFETSPPTDTPRPDLYSFFETLCVLRSDVRKNSRRTHETFARFGDTLDGFEHAVQELGRRLATEQQRDQMSLSAQKQFLIPFAQMLERIDRLAGKLAHPTQAGLFASNGKWMADWTAFKQGFDLLREHYQLLLQNFGVVPMETVGRAFDPEKMKAVAVEPSDTVAHNTVIEELATGYYLKKVVLKFAEVKIAINKKGNHS